MSQETLNVFEKEAAALPADALVLDLISLAQAGMHKAAQFYSFQKKAHQQLRSISEAVADEVVSAGMIDPDEKQAFIQALFNPVAAANLLKQAAIKLKAIQSHAAVKEAGIGLRPVEAGNGQKAANTDSRQLSHLSGVAEWAATGNMGYSPTANAQYDRDLGLI